jgi:hypothetical protein
MLIALFALVLIAITLCGAEIVRNECRRMLGNPIRPVQRAPERARSNFAARSVLE